MSQRAKQQGRDAKAPEPPLGRCRPELGSDGAEGIHSEARVHNTLLTGLIGLLLGAVTLALFWPVRGFDFIVLDDPTYFSENPVVLGGLSWPGVAWAFRTTLDASWYPLTWLSFMVDATLFGPGPGGPHLVNAAWHALNSVLLFGLLRRLTGALWPSALVGALFALHPLHVESVAWVSERKDVLSGFFFLLTLWAYARYAQAQGPVRKLQSPRPGSPPHVSRFTFHASRFYLLSAVCFTLGLLSKPMLVTLPVVLLLLDHWPLQRSAEWRMRKAEWPWRRLIWEKLPFFLLAAAAGVVTYVVHERQGAVTALASVGVGPRIAAALTAYAQYVGQTVWPMNLAMPYARPDHWPVAGVLAGVAVVAGGSAAAAWLGRRQRYLLVGWGWFLVMLVPVIGLVQWGIQPTADRFMYLPSIGLFVMLAWGLNELMHRWHRGRWLLAIAVVLSLVALGIRSRHQLGCWRDSVTLFSHALSGTAGNYIAHDNLGLALARRGDWAKAIEQYHLALKLKPDLAEVRHQLGDALRWQGNHDEAIRQCALALELNPALVEARVTLANSLCAQGKWSEAAQQYEAALQAKPELAEAHNNLGVALSRQERWAEAITHYEQALARQPGNASYEYNLAWLLATCPVGTLRDGNRAVALARQLDQASGGQDVNCLDLLAAALAETGQFPAAVQAAESAAALALAGNTPRVEEIRARLKLYQQGLPYHQPTRDSTPSPQP